MKRFGLIGHPIGHSLSPALFRAAYGGKYPYDLIEGEVFEESYARFIADYDGINITTPFKENAFAAADETTAECAAIGACNVLVKENGKIKAFNSDCLGVRLCIEEAGITEGSKVLIAGSGGAGKAAAVAAAGMGMKTTIVNRTFEKAVAFAQRAEKGGFKGIVCGAAEDFKELFRECDMLIYTLPKAALANMQDIADISSDGKRRVILEANYRDPAFVYDHGQSMGNSIFMNGHRWLLNQALTCYSLFTGVAPDLTAMEQVIEEK